MKTSQNLYVDGTDKVRGYILEVGVTRRRVAYLEVGESPYTVTFMLDDPAFLDKLSNEADRLCREFVGDVPDVIPDDCPNCKSDDCECLTGATL